MKVLFLSTYMHGGAASCAIRLGTALNQLKNNTLVKMLVRKGESNNWVHSLDGAYKAQGKLSFYSERLFFWPHEKSKKIRFAFSPANIGVDISKHPLVKEADILHLHWINQGFLSIKSIEKLIALGKPIVWSMHDMWIFTGGCHYAGNCINYQQTCGNCQFLKQPNSKDLSNKIWRAKEQVFPHSNITFVGSSAWLKTLGKKSSLLRNEKVINLVTPIDTSLFVPTETDLKGELNISKHKKVILFIAMSTTDERKGFSYLYESIKNLCTQQDSDKIELLVVGKADTKEFSDLPIKVHYLGLVSNKARIVQAYNTADVFVIPSLEDNLPNTVMESLACGTPVVGFNTGGIPEMIDHSKNGYVAQYRDASDLSKGINWIIKHPSPTELAKNARSKAENCYSYPSVAKQYQQLYESII